MSDEKRYMKAQPDRLVLDPITHKKLDDAGEWKPWNVHWSRKITHGDVVEVAPPAEPQTEDAALTAKAEGATKRSRKGATQE